MVNRWTTRMKLPKDAEKDPAGFVDSKENK